MLFKLSARELQILEDRDKIVARLRDGQERREGPIKPPVLVIADDRSQLIAIIHKDVDDEDVEEGADEKADRDNDDAVRTKVRTSELVSLFSFYEKLLLLQISELQ